MTYLLTNQLRKFPLGVPNWNAIRQQNLFFVDKTAKLGSLVNDFRRVFISRPPRMGKTTLCSTLAELFAHGDSEKFAGTAIHGNWPMKECFPVIYLSLRGLTNADDTDDKVFEANLCQKLAAAYVDAGFTEMSNYASETSFYSLAVHLASVVGRQPIVFLIDDCDAPLSQHLYQPQVLAGRQMVLQRFFSWLREQAQSRFILINGIMCYRESAMLLGDDCDDLSLDSYSAALLGYTQEELEGEGFAPYMTLAADSMGITKPELLEQLKHHYYGFCFDEDASVKVYSPYSINEFFDSVAREDKQGPKFLLFWMMSSKDNASLKSYLHSKHNQKFATMATQSN
ncbi:MAG: AAA family ATPase [Candidatus Anaerobiospirillum pullicola]|uniref:AAA family ATPase n=1 Tax=Candidatus Anaerobiospirillum pullicola TaxID=2838451 RepID=A0A948TEZ7_9GAMM|nr:AAA family ATPase [Candidatus Anaerobiospirillum pullicola]